MEKFKFEVSKLTFPEAEVSIKVWGLKMEDIEGANTEFLRTKGKSLFHFKEIVFNFIEIDVLSEFIEKKATDLDEYMIITCESDVLEVSQPFAKVKPKSFERVWDRASQEQRDDLVRLLAMIAVAGNKERSCSDTFEKDYEDICANLGLGGSLQGCEFTRRATNDIQELLNSMPSASLRFFLRESKTLDSLCSVNYLWGDTNLGPVQFQHSSEVLVVIFNDGKITLKSLEPVAELINGEKREDLVKLLVIVKVSQQYFSWNENEEDDFRLRYEKVCSNLQQHGYLANFHVQEDVRFVEGNDCVNQVTREMLSLLETLIPDKLNLAKDLYASQLPLSLEDFTRALQNNVPLGKLLDLTCRQEQTFSAESHLDEAKSFYKETVKELIVDSIFFSIEIAPNGSLFSVKKDTEITIYELNEDLSNLDKLEVDRLSRHLWHPSLPILAYEAKGAIKFWFSGSSQYDKPLDTSFKVHSFQWSPDGNFICQQSKDESEKAVLEVFQLSDGSLVQHLETDFSCEDCFFDWVSERQLYVYDVTTESLSLVETHFSDMSQVGQSLDLVVESQEGIYWSRDESIGIFLKAEPEPLYWRRDTKEVGKFSWWDTVRDYGSSIFGGWIQGKSTFWVLTYSEFSQDPSDLTCATLRFWDERLDLWTEKNFSFPGVSISRHLVFPQADYIIFLDSSNELHMICVQSGAEIFRYQLQQKAIWLQMLDDHELLIVTKEQNSLNFIHLHLSTR